ncbi:PilZ domain-containing protein [Pseudoduganella namucuonensis]|uniref:PilZ domain-containing protein n=2 Tax=Pseudoduganella namucuonensis TaxID=1035707 RepID=A0A1I7M4P4_9BURK|nr:PilZ domain-containing protein [Pseudoduganella namucuonensis]
MVVLDGATPAPARTIDICSTGISLTMGHMVPTGQTGQVSFEMLVDGKPMIITSRSKVTYCIFSGDDVKVGFQFINPEPAALAAIAKFMR